MVVLTYQSVQPNIYFGLGSHSSWCSWDHSNNGCMNTPECYVICTLPVLFLLAWQVKILSSTFPWHQSDVIKCPRFWFSKNGIPNFSKNLRCPADWKCFSDLYTYFSNSVCNNLGSGKIFSWGSNSDGQLGVGDTADRLAPTRVMGIQDDIVQLSAGCVSSAALTGKVLFSYIHTLCWVISQLSCN